MPGIAAVDFYISTQKCVLCMKFFSDSVPNFHHDRAIVCTGKHLCGAATDLMLRCIMVHKPIPKEHSSEEEMKFYRSFIKGVSLALCCHHRCEWRSYVGREFIQSCGLTCRQFQLLCGVTSWATCATKHVPIGVCVFSVFFFFLHWEYNRKTSRMTYTEKIYHE